MSIKDHFLYMNQVGSTVTCDPPVTDTDIDFICLLKESNSFESIHPLLIKSKWTPSYVDKYNNPQGHTISKPFRSYRKGKINYIITDDPKYYRKFMAATKMAKQFNLLKKSDRVTLFNYILYGEE